MKPVAALVAMVVLLLTATPFAAPAWAAPAITPDPGAGPVSLQLTQLDPRVVTATGPQTLTVVGTLTNSGPVTVDDLEIRVQRGQPLGTEGDVRDALDGSAATDAVQPQFVPLPGELAPGQSMPVRLAVLLRGRPDSSLALNATGVLELLVNVNGVPAGAARARLAAVRMLLPVLSLPPDPERATPSTTSSTPAPSALTLLYPIADEPRRLSTVPGEPTLLTDDELATSLAPDGRLGGLVAALAGVPVGSPVRDATCLAVDPDLVETAAAMRAGYQVVAPGRTPVPGTGAEVAGRWLDALSAAARGGCVLALPFADADLVALTRGGLGELAVTAQRDGRQLVTQLLGTPVVGQVTWPTDGVTDEATLDRIAEAGTPAVLLAADAVGQGRSQQRAGVVPLAGRATPQFAVLTDPLLGLAAAGPQPGLATASSGTGGAVTASTPAGTGTPLSTQDTIGALAFRARSGPDRSGAPIVLAPPHQWAAEGAGATALLQAVDTMLEAGFLTPRPLQGLLVAGPPDGSPTRAVSYPLRAGGREVVGAVADSVRATQAQIEDLRSAAVPDSGVGLNPDEVLEPLVRGLLRPMSAAWRGRPEGALSAAAAGAQRIGDLRGTVRVLEPPSPFALGTSDAPLLVTIGNGLPFTVRVQLEISSTSGLRVAPIDMQQVPPLGRRQVQVSAEVTRSGQFTVQASVRAPDGAPLGPPSRLRVRSTAYGTITVWLTASAGVLLVVLAIRRVRRRVRIEPPPHTGPIPLDPRPEHPGPAGPPAPPVPQWTRPVPHPTGASRPAGPTHGHPTGDPFPDPVPTRPTPTPPTPTGSAPTGSAPVQPLPTPPVSVRSGAPTPAAPTQPRPTQPTPPPLGSQPAGTPPAGTPPAGTPPADTPPADTRPTPTQPTLTSPGPPAPGPPALTRPAPAQPNAAQPNAAQPNAAQPTPTQPGPNQPTGNPATNGSPPIVPPPPGPAELTAPLQLTRPAGPRPPTRRRTEESGPDPTPPTR